MELFGRQHRPVECSFSWESLDVIGYTLYKTAAFDLKDVPKPVWDPRWNLSPEHDRPHTFDEWDSRWERRFAETQDSDLRWQVINQFCIHELKACGGVWGEGPQLRAQPPTFIPKQVCPPQHRNHCAATRTSSIMHKLQRQLDELFLRRARGFSSDQDRHIFRVTACKLQKRFRTLSMPFVWPHHELITLVHIQQAKKWVLNELESHFKRLKTDRIQKWKQRIQHSASRGYIFEHLRNRLQDEPANLVEDDLGNILYQPECALKHLNSKWDDVYAANVLHDHPLQMLKTIWPYIHDKSTQANLPPIDADVLFRTVHKRKTAAAPGLDGWRTCELQALPSHCFAPIARFFRWIEQNPQIPLPEALTCSKQVILNKPGPSSAMNKRLITILPALWLSYTGARFEQLQTWQIVSMPNCIIGGVKGRTMPELHTALRLDIDVARDRKQELIGIKLDKAKCFDRLIPAFTASLFLAFGLPAFFVSVFLRMYDSLRRHIAYKGWINPISTTAPNGVVQGCSISLIAVNVHTKVWVHLLELLPDLSMRAFVDDAYIWCHLQRIDVLSRAIELTRLWDEINGQKLNDSKSSIWGTTGTARKAVACAFPDMKLVHALDTLGTRIYTSDKDDYKFNSQTLQHVCTAIEAIGALPIPRNIKSQLIGAKAIPKLTYGSHISKTPKAALQKVQNTVAKALWQGRPGIRAKHLVMTFFGSPHRVDPFIAMAYNCLLDVFRFCFGNEIAVSRMQALNESKNGPKHSLVAAYHSACDTLGLTVNTSLAISFHGSECLPLEMRRFLQQIALQAQYFSVTHKKRKDVCKPSGLLDLRLSTNFLHHPTFQTPAFPSAVSHFESVLVGCTLTKDRLCATGWASDSWCRFCGKTKETLAHIVFECTVYHSWTSTPVLHEFGANFALLGIFEHPTAIARHRIRLSKAEATDAVSFDAMLDTEELWTDGSLIWQQHHWTATAAYAVVRQDGTICKSGPVQALTLSSYVPELWAIWTAFSSCCAPVHVYTDSKSVAEQCQYMIAEEGIQSEWKCFSWWKQIYLDSCTQVGEPC